MVGPSWLAWAAGFAGDLRWRAGVPLADVRQGRGEWAVRVGWSRMWQATAWGGIGLSLYAGWLTFDDVRDRASSERQISKSCNGLVSGAEVMDLQGGMVRATADYEGPLNARYLPSKCVIYRVPGEGNTEELFTLAVASSGVRGAPLSGCPAAGSRLAAARHHSQEEGRGCLVADSSRREPVSRGDLRFLCRAQGLYEAGRLSSVPLRDGELHRHARAFNG